MTTEQAEKRVLRWYGSMPAGDFYADVQAYREAIRAETAAPLEEALREARKWLDIAAHWLEAEARAYEQKADHLHGRAKGLRAGRVELDRVLAETDPERALSSPGGGE